MRLVWVMIGGPAGGLIGALVGLGIALAVMSLGPARTDGTYGMREMLVCVPASAIIGFVAGVVWAFRTKIGTG